MLKNRFFILSWLRCDIPPIFNMVKSFVMSSTNAMKSRHDPMKNDTVVTTLEITMKTETCKSVIAIKKPNGVLQLNGNLKRMEKGSDVRNFSINFSTHTSLAQATRRILLSCR